MLWMDELYKVSWRIEDDCTTAASVMLDIDTDADINWTCN